MIFTNQSAAAHYQIAPAGLWSQKNRAPLSLPMSGSTKSVFNQMLAACQLQLAHKSPAVGLTACDYLADPVYKCTTHSVNNGLSSLSQKTIRSPDSIPRSKKPEPEKCVSNRNLIEKSVQKAAAKYDLSPALIKAVIKAESNFDVQAVSAAGAQGLMQLMPATAAELGVKNPFNVDQNIEAGSRYLKKMIDRFDGNLKLALAAYNAGPGTVERYQGNVPYPETQQYVNRVLRFSGMVA